MDRELLYHVSLTSTTSFSVPGETEKIVGFWFARGVSIQTDTMIILLLYHQELTSVAYSIFENLPHKCFKLVNNIPSVVEQ